MIIDYQKIAEAIKHYSSLGYQYTEVPWMVGRPAIDATLPENISPYLLTTNNGCFHGYPVGSAEQSFIEMMLSPGGLKPGKYMAVTPCFRNETHIDELHQRYFMKLELIHYEPALLTDKKFNMSLDRYAEYYAMVDDARLFFNRYFDKSVNVEYVDSLGNQIDIFSPIKGIELGSYGIRKYRGHTWIYGTGVALPRLDIAIEKEKNA